MRVFIVAALTADGFIAKDSNHGADWTSREDKNLFVTLTKEAGVMVMGGNTFRAIGRALPERRNIVYSRKATRHKGVETTEEAPKELISRLAAEGHDAVAIIGGQVIYDMFLAAGVVDELYLTYEPLLFGAGLTLAKQPLTTSLRLKECRQLNENSVLLHYEVTK